MSREILRVSLPREMAIAATHYGIRTEGTITWSATTSIVYDNGFIEISSGPSRMVIPASNCVWQWRETARATAPEPSKKRGPGRPPEKRGR